MDPLKLLVSVIHNTEYNKKGMEAELSSERKLSETYRKRSVVMMGELRAKEIQIKKIQSMKKTISICYVYMCVLLLIM